MNRRNFTQPAVILNHPARIYRAWQIVDEGDGTFTGVLRSREKCEARTETGPLYLVRDAIDGCWRYRGAPVWPNLVRRKRGAA